MPACSAPKRAAGLADARHQASSSGVSDEQSKVCPLARARPLLPSVCAARWRRAHSLCACALRRCVQLEPCSPVSSPSSLPATRVADAHGHDRRSRCRCRRTTRRSAARALEGCATDICYACRVCREPLGDCLNACDPYRRMAVGCRSGLPPEDGRQLEQCIVTCFVHVRSI